MPSFSKVIKNDQLDSVSQFSFSGLKELSVSAQPIENPSGKLPDQAFSPSTLKDNSKKIENDGPLSPVPTVDLVINRVPILHDVKKQETIHLWTVPEFKREVTVRKEKSTLEKVEDNSYLITEAKEKADEIISTADMNASGIIAQAKTEAESLKQKAFMEGMNTAKNEVAETMHQVERMFQETQLWQEQVMHQSQSRIMDMVLAMGKKLFGTGFELPANQVDHVVSRAINEASRLGNLRIYLNPEDAKLLVNLWQESELTLNGQQIQIVSSQNISRGGCFIDGQFGIVDGRVEEQVDQITAAIKSAEINLEIEE
jgi:flagellar assembly protein FliH